MNRYLRARLLPFLLFTTLLLACKQDEAEAPDDHHHGVVHTVALRLKFVFVHGTHDYELASEYTDDFGHLYKLDKIRFLLSDLDVVDDFSGVLADYPSVQLLVDASQTNDFALGSLTASHAHQIRFTMGLNPQMNDSDPTTSAAPLNDATMHWGMGANEGYWFLVMEGRVDSDNSGTVDDTDTPFTYRCGTDLLARSGWATMHVEIPDGGSMTVEAPVDVERLMGGVDVLGIPSALGDAPLNEQLMDSLSANFNEAH
jgi:hypothetical protein